MLQDSILIEVTNKKSPKLGLFYVYVYVLLY